MTKKSELGRKGEDAAVKFLKSNGYKILDRNYLKPWGEIDVIALAPTSTLRRLGLGGQGRTLIFVEVKTVSGKNPRITGEDQVTSAKLKKLRRACELYANNNQKLSENGWQIDLLTINHFDDRWYIKHYENI